MSETRKALWQHAGEMLEMLATSRPTYDSEDGPLWVAQVVEHVAILGFASEVSPTAFGEIAAATADRLEDENDEE